MLRRHHILCAILLLATSGCSGHSLQDLRSVTPKGTPFQAALAVRYLRLSEDEAHNYDWINSGYFADKGLAAAYGQDVPPEKLERWDIPQERLTELQSARAQLEAALTPGHIAATPDTAADAQVNFDCWADSAEKSNAQSALDDCRQGFTRAMAELDRTGASAAPGAVSASTSAVTTATQAYLVFFGFNSDALDERGERMLDDVAADLQREGGNYSVTLNGHADRVGGARYNFTLSLKRAEAVLAALVERGVPKALIRAFGFGDTDPRVPEKRGVPEPENRRVEIYIGGK